MNDDRIAEILGEWRERRDRGEDAEPEEVIRAHPDLADALRARFRAIAALDGTASTPKRIGEFRILREIGRGGMGVVYEAEQTSMRRRVALKVLYPAVTAVPKAVQRFQQEAYAAGRLKHTNIVAVYQLGNDQGVWYSAMELVEGRPLSEVVADLRETGRRPRESRLARRALGVSTQGGLTGDATGTRAYYHRVAEMFAGVAEALQVAHDHGVIHRDLKPGNLILDVEGNLKLVDFGLARLEDAAGMTVTGDVLGTPYYMSPEQVTGKGSQLDHRTDIYSLGAALYESLALVPPFRGNTLQAVGTRILKQDPAPLRRWDPRVPRDLDTIVLKALEKDPARRYRSAGDMAADLRRFAQGGAIHARRIGPVGVAWRRIQRHKLPSALLAALLISVLVSGAFYFRARREQARRESELVQRVAAEYEMLCVRAHEAVAVTFHASQFPRVGDDASELFGRAIELAPGRPEAYFGRAFVTSRSVEDRLADIAGAEARGMAPRTVHLARSHVLALAGRSAEAGTEARRAEDLAREAPEDAFFEARILIRRGEYTDATRLLTEAIDATPRTSSLHARAQRSRAFARERLGDYEGAIADLAAAEGAADEPVRTQVQIAALWRKLGRAESSERLFEEALAACREKGTEGAWYALCEASMWRGETEWLGRGSEEGLQNHPHSAPLLVARATFLRRKGALDEALQTCEEALAIDAGNPWIYATKGTILSAMDRPLDAVATHQQALDRNSDEPQLWTNLAIAHEEAGHPEDARDAFERALAGGRSSWSVLCNAAAFYLDIEPQRALHLARTAVKVEPRNCRCHLKVGAALGRLGDPEGALEATRRGVELDPGNAEARYDLAVRLFRLGKLAPAMAQADKAAELGWSKAQWIRGDLLKAMGQPADAVAAFDQATRDTPREPQPWAAKAWTLFDLGRYAEARDAAKEAIRRAKWPHKVSPPGWAHNALSAALLELGENDESLRAAEDAIAAQPENAEGWHRKALALHRLGKPQDAVCALDETIRREPNNALYWSNKALILFNSLGKRKEGALAMKRSFEIRLDAEPDNPMLHTQLGTVYNDLGEPDNALKCYARALELQPGFADAYYNTGNVYLGLRRFEDAAAAFDRALRANPQHVGACWNLHLACRSLHQWDRALKAVDTFCKLRPKEPNGPLVKAEILTQLGMPDAARAALEAAIRAGLRDARLFDTLALQYIEPDPKRAVELARQAASVNPRACRVLAAALVRAGEWREAVRALDTAMRLHDGGDPGEWLHAAMALWHLDKKDAARRWYGKSAAWIDRNAPNDARLLKLRDEVKQLLAIG